MFCWDYIKRMKLCIRLEDVCREVSKSDWKLFIRSSIAEWQENYMERLVKESIDLLKGEGNASDKHYDKKYEDYIFQQSGIDNISVCRYSIERREYSFYNMTRKRFQVKSVIWGGAFLYQPKYASRLKEGIQ